MSISNVYLADNLNISLVNPYGEVTTSIQQLPQGFLNSWNITPSVIDARVSAIKTRELQQILQTKIAEAAKEEQEIDASAIELQVRVEQVINGQEILAGYDDSSKMIHISGINTSNLAQGNHYSFKVWSNGIFRYKTVLGASSQIESYTGSRDEALRNER